MSKQMPQLLGELVLNSGFSLALGKGECRYSSRQSAAG